MNRGLLFAVASNLIWGLFPLFWPLLEPAGAVEILAHRMIWSLVVMALVTTALRRWRTVWPMSGRTLLLVICGAALISTNWGVYIYAVNNGAVTEAAFGYFINPLLSVLLGVLVFHERLRPLQWAAVGLAVSAVLVIAIAGGRVPWLALGLAASFATYALVKKVVPLAPQASMTAESLVVLIPALIYIVVLQANGEGTLTGHGVGHVLLFAAGGVITVIPLVLFAAAAQALPLTLLGLLQYLTPVLQFLLGVFWAHEQMSPARWVGFALVWLALCLLSADGLRRRREPAVRQPGSVPAGDRDRPVTDQ